MESKLPAALTFMIRVVGFLRYECAWLPGQVNIAVNAVYLCSTCASVCGNSTWHCFRRGWF
jgi:hypothetical protein